MIALPFLVVCGSTLTELLVMTVLEGGLGSEGEGPTELVVPQVDGVWVAE